MLYACTVSVLCTCMNTINTVQPPTKAWTKAMHWNSIVDTTYIMKTHFLQDSLQQPWCPWSWQTKVGHFLASHTVESLTYDILLHIYWSSLVYMKGKLIQDYFKSLHKVTHEAKIEKTCRDGVPKNTQTREDLKVKVNMQSLPHPYILSQHTEHFLFQTRAVFFTM